jgi:heme-degrading monooxygenase HmoA
MIQRQAACCRLLDQAGEPTAGLTTDHLNRRVQMIARHWRGWTKAENADRYEAFLKQNVIPGLRAIDGYRGGYVLRREAGQETEFVVINLFDSLEAVKRFAGDDYAVAVFEPEAKRLLSRIDPFAAHYEVRVAPA